MDGRHLDLPSSFAHLMICRCDWNAESKEATQTHKRERCYHWASSLNCGTSGPPPSACASARLIIGRFVFRPVNNDSLQLIWWINEGGRCFPVAFLVFEAGRDEKHLAGWRTECMELISRGQVFFLYDNSRMQYRHGPLSDLFSCTLLRLECRPLIRLDSNRMRQRRWKRIFSESLMQYHVRLLWTESFSCEISPQVTFQPSAKAANLMQVRDSKGSLRPLSSCWWVWWCIEPQGFRFDVRMNIARSKNSFIFFTWLHPSIFWRSNCKKEAL